MQNAIIEKIEQAHRKESLPALEPGDQIKVHVKIREGEKERIQVFEGILLARNNTGMRETITVAEGEFRTGRRAHLPATRTHHREDRDCEAAQGAAGEALLPAQAQGQGGAPQGAFETIALTAGYNRAGRVSPWC